MFKFIHAADIHLDSPLHKLDAYEGAPVDAFRQATRRAFENLVRLAISEKVAFVIIAGDLFDGDWKDYNTGLYFVSQMARLRNAGIPVFMIAGNHDAASRITRTLRFPDNVTRFASNKPETVCMDAPAVAIHGQSFASPAVKKDLSRAYPPGLTGYFNIGLLHTCATGREGHEPYAPCSPNALSGKGYDYWALGHAHQHEVLSTDPPIVFSGNTQGRHAREIGPKGCVLVTVSDTDVPQMAFCATDVVRWAKMDLIVQDTHSGYDIIDQFSRRLDPLLEANGAMPLALRLHIRGETAAHDDILSDVERWTGELRAAALESGGGRIWIEKVQFALTRPPSDKTLEKTGGAVAELLNLFEELNGDADARRELLLELADIEKKLPRELTHGSDDLHFGDPDWMIDLLKQVRPILLKRLLGKEPAE